MDLIYENNFIFTPYRVEGKIFYGHKIVLVTASPRFQSMLSSKLSEGNNPTVQINDIRYHIFQLVMQYLYSGGCNTLEVSQGDCLELMAAASFFQLEGLLRFTEARCSEMIDIDNVVAMYIHAKVNRARIPKFWFSILTTISLCRSTTLRNYWNIVKDSFCKTWLLCSHTMIPSSVYFSLKRFLIMMS